MWFQNPARHFIYFYNTIKLLHPLFQNERCITQHIKGTLWPKLSNKIVEIVRYAENWPAPGAWEMGGEHHMFRAPGESLGQYGLRY